MSRSGVYFYMHILPAFVYNFGVASRHSASRDGGWESKWDVVVLFFRENSLSNVPESAYDKVWVIFFTFCNMVHFIIFRFV